MFSLQYLGTPFPCQIIFTAFVNELFTLRISPGVLYTYVIGIYPKKMQYPVIISIQVSVRLTVTRKSNQRRHYGKVNMINY